MSKCRGGMKSNHMLFNSEATQNEQKIKKE